MFKDCHKSALKLWSELEVSSGFGAGFLQVLQVIVLRVLVLTDCLLLLGRVLSGLGSRRVFETTFCLFFVFVTGLRKVLAVFQCSLDSLLTSFIALFLVGFWLVLAKTGGGLCLVLYWFSLIFFVLFWCLLPNFLRS